jgi:hypothetical protein
MIEKEMLLKTSNKQYKQYARFELVTTSLVRGRRTIIIEVNVILEANGGSGILCSLESVDAAELIETQFAERK